MIAQPFFLGLVMVSATALTVAGVMLIISALERRRDTLQEASRLGSNRLDAVLLFEDGAFVDANDRGEALLATLRSSAQRQNRWQALLHHLKPGFPDLDQCLADLPGKGSLLLRAQDSSGLELRADWLSGTIRFTIIDTEEEAGGVLLDRLSLRAMNEETEILRRVCAQVPVLAWREDGAGNVIWANDAYLRQSAELAADGRADDPVGWPLPALFPVAAAGSTQRLALSGRDNMAPGHTSGPRQTRRKLRWFDVSRHADGTGQLAFAVSADGAQQAEKARHEFVQTLSKTFATLPIGLGVFDRTRRLQLFNPALIDLTGLEPEFLASQPALAGFLNRLRDKRILPEPRDYAGWSRRLLDIEKGFETNQFEETWSLPTGQTYRVSASPHPDGALAFLIEDITSEIHMSRNIRAELETCRTALDALPTAVALFSADGNLIQTNAAFSRLWAFEGEDALSGVSLDEAIANWHETTDDKPLWDRIAALAQHGQPKGYVRGDMQLDDAEVLVVSACKAGAGSLMITFDQREALTDAQRNRMSDATSALHVPATKPTPDKDAMADLAACEPALPGPAVTGKPAEGADARPGQALPPGGATQDAIQTTNDAEVTAGARPGAPRESNAVTDQDETGNDAHPAADEPAQKELVQRRMLPSDRSAQTAIPIKGSDKDQNDRTRVIRRSSGRMRPGGTKRSSA